MEKSYVEHPGKVVEDGRFKHMMALALDPSSGYKRGVIRCITSREGNIEIKGYTDRSELHTVSGDSLESFAVGERLNIKNEDEIISKMKDSDREFIGLEDPDIFIDEKTGLMHLYFTIPFISKNKLEKHTHIHLGHAVGKDLDSLEMTMPALTGSEANAAKELSIAPENSKGGRYNLIESSLMKDNVWYSTVRVARAKDMGEPWEFGETVFNPMEHDISWAGGHASPGPLLSKNFIDVGEGKALVIMNGREANTVIDGKVHYNIFSVGLMIYDYENGKIDWVSPEPLIRDSEAKNITFASQFVDTKPGEGILYAHVDDSFVRAYTLNAEAIRKLLP